MIVTAILISRQRNTFIGAVLCCALALFYAPHFADAQSSTGLPGVSGGYSVGSLYTDALNLQEMLDNYVGTISSEPSLSAYPTSGGYPLTVRFSASLTDPGSYSIDFGDDETGEFTICAQSYPYRCSLSHTYGATGTYTAELVDASGDAADSMTITVGDEPNEDGGSGADDTGGIIGYGNLENPIVTPPSGASIQRDLGIGSSGSDVSALQNYLRSTGDFQYSTATGYYGPVTEAAVKRFQARTGIVSSGDAESTGFGVVGPLTRATLNNAGVSWLSSSGGAVIYPGVNSSNNSGSPRGPFKAYPTSGDAPLGVRFTASNLTGDASDYRVSFGDGGSGNGRCSITSTSVCENDKRYFTHTYTEAGTYTASLIYDPCSDNSSTSCKAPASVVGTVTITVTGDSIRRDVTFTANPRFGAAPLGVRFTATGIDESKSYKVNFGDGESSNGRCSITSTSVCVQGTRYFTHTYAAAGTYTATLYRHTGPAGGEGQDVRIDSVTVPVGDSSDNTDDGRSERTTTSSSDRSSVEGTSITVTFSNGTERTVDLGSSISEEIVQKVVNQLKQYDFIKGVQSTSSERRTNANTTNTTQSSPPKYEDNVRKYHVPAPNGYWYYVPNEETDTPGAPGRWYFQYVRSDTARD